MKTVKLTEEEIRVILTALNERKICEVRCYCDYKDNMCDKLTPEGKPACKLKQTINSIEEKLDLP